MRPRRVQHPGVKVSLDRMIEYDEAGGAERIGQVLQ
jgi:hypothetical protein